MPALFSLCMVAILLWSTGAGAACLFHKHRTCVDFSGIPGITQQIIGPAQIPAAPKSVAPPPESGVTDKSSTYNGPTLGFSRMIRRAPEIGYHWSTN